MFKIFHIYNRPISPHLLVYSPQLTSLFSIWHRITGVVLATFSSFFLLILKILTIYNYFYMVIENEFMLISNNSSWIINYIFLLIFTLLIYHILNGLRHILWDIGLFLNIKSLFLSSWSFIIIITSILILNIIITF